MQVIFLCYCKILEKNLYTSKEFPNHPSGQLQGLGSANMKKMDKIWNQNMPQTKDVWTLQIDWMQLRIELYRTT